MRACAMGGVSLVLGWYLCQVWTHGLAEHG